METVILSIENLSKSFRSHWTFRPTKAVKNLSLDIYKGESFGFLGHNGAGKTTAIKCIIGLIKKNTGSVKLNGKELTRATQRSIIGYLPEQPYFYDHLTVNETLQFLAALQGLNSLERKQAVSRVLELLKLETRAKNCVRDLSKGLQQRLGFAQAIMSEPQLLILDEPFSGLDPIGRLDLRTIILDLKKQGTTIFLSSHILSDVEDICDRVSVMSNGELKRVFSLSDIPKLFGSSFEVKIKSSGADDTVLAQLKQITDSEQIEQTAAGRIHTYRFNNYEAASSALSKAISGGVCVESFQSSGVHLEDIFMKITNDTTTDKSDLSSSNDNCNGVRDTNGYEESRQ